MTRTLNIEDVANPYTQRTKEGVLWWILSVASFLRVIVSDIVGVGLVWWFTENGTSIARLQDVQLVFLVMMAYVVTAYSLLYAIRFFSGRVLDSIPGTSGVVIVQELPGLQATEFFTRIVPHTLWMVTMLMAGKYLLGFSPMMLVFILVVYYLYTVRSLRYAVESLFVARNRFGFAALVMAITLVGISIPVVNILTADQITMVLAFVTYIFVLDYLLRSPLSRLRQRRLGITYRLAMATKMNPAGERSAL